MPLFSVALFALLAAPRGAHMYMLLASIAICGTLKFNESLQEAASRLPVRITCAVAVYLLLAGAFSPDPLTGLRHASGISAALVLTAIVASWIATKSDRSWCQAICLAGAQTIFAGALFISADVMSNQSLTTHVLNHFPALHGGSTKHVMMADGTIVGVYRYVLNRNMGVLNLVLWPAIALYAVALGRAVRNRTPLALPLALVVLVTVATFLSDHESSKVALLASASVFLIAQLSLEAARKIVTIGWIASCLFVIPITQAAFRENLQDSEYLTASARGRVLRWNTISSMIPNAPVFGIGLDGTRYYSDLVENAQPCNKDACLRDTGRHPHNVYLQFWYELGFVGAGLFTICGLLLIRLIGRTSAWLKPFAFAAFTTVASMLAFSWSIWQLWLCSAMCITVLLLALAHRGSSDSFPRA